MRHITKAAALAVTVAALCGGAVLTAPAASADPGPPLCGPATEGHYWTDPWNGITYRCVRDGGYWVWIDPR